jgi:hypothetical protein
LQRRGRRHAGPSETIGCTAQLIEGAPTNGEHYNCILTKQFGDATISAKAAKDLSDERMDRLPGVPNDSLTDGVHRLRY